MCIRDSREIYPDEETPEFLRDVETVEDVLAKVRELLTGPISIEEDFNRDGREEELRVNLSAWFDAPPQDLKAFLPYHRWYPENFGNDDFYDDLKLTDSQENSLGPDDPPFVLPDPTFGGILPQFTSNEEFRDFFGIPSQGGAPPIDPLDRAPEPSFPKPTGKEKLVLVNDSPYVLHIACYDEGGDILVEGTVKPGGRLELGPVEGFVTITASWEEGGVCKELTVEWMIYQYTVLHFEYNDSLGEMYYWPEWEEEQV
mgnify:CR=1 FL=1